ncbi:MAG TPA: hypothetical protein VM370_00750 [Candidatus Thermoplasmatota archaeon]|nr:hypothetical protein [Candidatus Thermoplasmatota archaeon]
MRALLLLLVLTVGCVAGPEVGQVAPHGPTWLAGGTRAAEDDASGGLEVVAQAEAPGGYALRILGDRAYVATFTTEEGISVFDIRDPLAPVHLGGIVGTLARSVDVLDYGDRIAVALSTGTELEVWDLTDPEEPARLASFPFGSHNVAVHPDAKIIYNARNVWDGVGGAMEIVDASDPLDIRLDSVFTFPPLAADGTTVHDQGCHDFTVWPDEERAYCAAYEQTLVFDIADPKRPVILTAIENPLITSHHTAFPILDHTVLVIGDEWLDNFVWGCVGAGLPAGALWFYDLTVSPPAPLSYIQAPDTTLPADPALLLPLQGAMCTSHNGMELGAGTGRIAYGWFHAGVALIDASDPRAPQLLDLDDVGGAVGDARWHDGRVFAVDDAVGLTVLVPSP